MKTARQTTGNFPRPGRLSLYVCAVLVLCFFNWVALDAQTVKKDSEHMAIDMEEENEPAIRLQDWMMYFENGFLAVNEEPELRVEPWMLSFNLDYMTGSEASMISFEPWMVNFEERCLVVENEQDYPLECWMVNTCTWECIPGILAKK